MIEEIKMKHKININLEININLDENKVKKLVQELTIDFKANKKEIGFMILTAQIMMKAFSAGELT